MLLEGDEVDIELRMPVDMNSESTDKFVFRVRLNVVVTSYKGHPMGLQDVCNQLNQYMGAHNLQPITVGYNVTKKTDMLSSENTEIDVHMEISLNIL